MIPSYVIISRGPVSVYQRGLVIDSQLDLVEVAAAVSISKGIGD